jgi:hypothetical protein
VEVVERMLREARAALHGAPREALGILSTGRRVLGFRRADRIVAGGDAWHLGVLLLTDDAVLATGEIVRARREVIRGFTAESQRARAALAAAAARGGFAEGEVVHVGWRAIELGTLDAQSSPISVRAGDPFVRWSASAGAAPLAAYLDEQVELLRHPPERA